MGFNSFGQEITTNLSTLGSSGLLFTPSAPNGSAGTVTPLTGLDSPTYFTLTAINKNGTIVGDSCFQCPTPSRLDVGFLWTPTAPNGTLGTYSEIPMPAGFTALTPKAMNDQGDVVGVMGSAYGTSIPFLYTGGVVYDLTTLSSLLVGAQPVGINSARQIVLNCAGPNSVESCLATPQIIVPPTAPFGHIDTPANDSSGIAGELSVTGWALSSPAVNNVGLWRETVPNEYACVPQPKDECLVFLGNAAITPGTRPDVAQTDPGYSYNTAGWGLQLLTNELPDANGKSGMGNGTYRIHAIAANTAGQSTDMGTIAISVDNADSVLPFGTIDTPTQGGTASGTAFVNFGWAVTPQPDLIPLDGSTITVYIDNLPVGHPVYNNYRVDIATLFPGLQNSGGAVGYFYIDTTKLTNGLHTISWLARDNAGNAAGLGSRYFNVQN